MSQPLHNNRHKPQPRTRKWTVNVSVDEYMAAYRESNMLGITISEYVRRLVAYDAHCREQDRGTLAGLDA